MILSSGSSDESGIAIKTIRYEERKKKRKREKERREGCHVAQEKRGSVQSVSAQKLIEKREREKEKRRERETVDRRTSVPKIKTVSP